MSPKTSNNGFGFPLYLYPKAEKKNLLDPLAAASNAQGGRRPNLADSFIQDLVALLNLDWVADGKGNLKKTIGPEDAFNYIYAVLHSPTYRERYSGFLKIDFPRLPLTSNVKFFRSLCELSAELVKTHLMEGHVSPMTDYLIEGGDQVGKVTYTGPKENFAGRVWINDTQYFEGVKQEVWDFHIGGYQVCHKWLKDRKGRTLTDGDIAHYQKIIVALSETIRIMGEIDEVIEEHDGWPGAFVSEQVTE